MSRPRWRYTTPASSAERDVDYIHQARVETGCLHVICDVPVAYWQLVDGKTTGLRTKFTFLRLHRLPWLAHVPCVEDRRICTDILSGQVASDKRDTNLQQLRYRDVVKRDMKGLATNAKLDTWMILSLPLDFCFRPISLIFFCLLRNRSNKAK